MSALGGNCRHLASGDLPCGQIFQHAAEEVLLDGLDLGLDLREPSSCDASYVGTCI